jgi:hypothetical protein
MVAGSTIEDFIESHLKGLLPEYTVMLETHSGNGRDDYNPRKVTITCKATGKTLNTEVKHGKGSLLRFIIEILKRMPRPRTFNVNLEHGDNDPELRQFLGRVRALIP